MECLEQSFRGSVHPSLIHVHGHEPVQQGGVFVSAPAGMIRHHFVGRVNTQTVLSRYATSDGRFACTAPAADPVDVWELLRHERLDYRPEFIRHEGLHAPDTNSLLTRL